MSLFMSSISQVSSAGAIESVLAAKQSAAQSQVAYKVAGKALDAQRTSGDAAIALLDAATQVGTDGKGVQLDVSR